MSQTRTSGQPQTGVRPAILMLPFSLLWVLVASAVMLLPLMWAKAHGFVDPEIIRLWAISKLAVHGPEGFEFTNPLYPPLPILLTIAMEWLIGNTARSAPFLVSSLIAGWLLVRWYLYLRRFAVYGPVESFVLIALVAINPLFLRAVAAGPSIMLLFLGCWVLFNNLARFRTSGYLADMMALSFGIALLAVAHSYGILLLFAALPFLVLASHPSLLVSSPSGYLATLLFPLLLTIISLLFVEYLFGIELLVVPRAEAHPTELVAQLLPVVFLIPTILAALFGTIGRPHRWIPLLSVLGTAMAAYGFNLIFDFESDPFVTLLPLLPAYILALRSIPRLRLRGIMLTILGIAAIISSAVSFINPTQTHSTAVWSQAILSEVGMNNAPFQAASIAAAETMDSSSDEVAAFLADKAGIMMDAERHPKLVIALGKTDELLLSGSPAYDIFLNGGRLDADYVVIPSGANQTLLQDRLINRLPALLDNNVASHKRVFSNADWQILQRWRTEEIAQ